MRSGGLGVRRHAWLVAGGLAVAVGSIAAGATVADDSSTFEPVTVAARALRLDEQVRGDRWPCPFGVAIESDERGGYHLVRDDYDGRRANDQVFDLDHLGERWLWTPTATAGIDCGTAVVRGGFNVHYGIDLATGETWTFLYEPGDDPITWHATIDGYVAAFRTATGWELRNEVTGEFVRSFTTPHPSAVSEGVVDVSAEGRHIIVRSWHTNRSATHRVYHAASSVPAFTVAGGQNFTISPSGNVLAYERTWATNDPATRIVADPRLPEHWIDHLAVVDLRTARTRVFDIKASTDNYNLLDDSTLFACGSGTLLLDLDRARLLWNNPSPHAGPSVPTAPLTYCPSLTSSP